MTSWERISGPVPHARRPVALVAAVAFGYAAGSLVSFLLFGAGSLGAVLFPPAGVTLAALLLTPGRQWPLVLVTAAAVEAVLDLANGLPLVSVPGFMLANTAEPLVGALIVRRSGSGFELRRSRDLGRFFIGGVVLGPLVGGLVGATTIALALHHSWLDAFLPFWAGDALGALAVGGTVLTWVAAGRVPRPVMLRRAGFLLLTVAVTVVAFWPIRVPLAYLPIPLLFLFAVRYGAPLVTAAGLALTLTANVVTGEGRGPWAGLMGGLEIATLQLFLAVTIGGAWLLAVESGERQRATSRSTHEAAARRQVEALQAVTAGLANAATSEDIAEVVVRRGIGMLAAKGAVGVVTPDGAALRAWTTESPGRSRQIDLGSTEPLAVAARTGAPVAVRTADELAGTRLVPGAASALAVPARIGDVTVGALVVGFADEDAVGSDAVALAGTLAELMVQALLRARLYEDEREAAHQLQRAFLPVVPERLADVPIGGCYRPADQQHEIGGDWYDAFALPDGRIGFAVGDVVGHDLPAAAAMGRLHAALRVIAAAPHEGPRQVLEALDRACAHIPGAPLATIGYGEYDPASGALRYACAGHPPPLLVVDGRPEFLLQGRSRPLAAMDGPRPEAAVVAPPGAMLLWYSDGLVERRDSDLDTGLQRLAEVAATVEGSSPQEWCDTVLGRLTGERTVADDVVLICLRLERTPTAPSTGIDDGDVLAVPSSRR
jgi:serine phosphatase RsbU (regulator of sigma subunit)/integral membrane sensor domain MASE1